MADKILDEAKKSSADDDKGHTVSGDEMRFSQEEDADIFRSSLDEEDTSDEEKGDGRSAAKKDPVLQHLASINEIQGDVYSSDDDFDFPYDNDELSDDLDEMVLREQIQEAKKLFYEITEDDEILDIVKSPSQIIDKIEEITDSVKNSDILSFLQNAIETNSKMRDKLLILEQALLHKQTQLKDMISELENKEVEYEEIKYSGADEKQDDIVSLGCPFYNPPQGGVVFSEVVSTFFNQFSYPYFKDQHGFPCPPNYDTLSRKKNNLVRVSDLPVSKPWCSSSLESLEIIIKKCLVKEFKDRPDFKSIYRWKEYSNYVKNHTLKEILKDKEFKFDWLKIATMTLNYGNRSPTECEKIWNLYLSPKYNKEVWSQEENNKIMSMVDQLKEQNWDLVCQELGTERSPFQTFVHYQSNLRQKKLCGLRWTPEEDARLKKVVEWSSYGSFISWKKVLYYFENKLYTQVYGRYQNTLAIKKRGKFSLNEDKALITTVVKHGLKYNEAKEALRGERSLQQIRGRVSDILSLIKSSKNFGEFSKEEDEKLINLVELHGRNWSKIGKEFGSRDRTQIRHRYRRLEKRLSDPEFNLDKIDRSISHIGKKVKARNKKLLQMVKKKVAEKALSQKQKKTWLSDVQKQLIEGSEDSDSSSENIRSGNTKRTPPDKKDPLISYLLEAGSSKWIDVQNVIPGEVGQELTAAFCSTLGAQLSADFNLETALSDEHLKSICELLPMLQSDTFRQGFNGNQLPHDEGSTSQGMSPRNINVLPPNFLTCSGFFNLLSFCTQIEKDKYKHNSVESENKQLEQSKLMWKKRLVQLFLWPAVLSNKDKKNRLNTYAIQKFPK